MRRALVGVVIAGFMVLFAATAEAADPADPNGAILAAVASGDTATAVAELGRLEAEDAQTFRANNYDYLLARVLELRGDYAGATARYTAVVDRNSNLAEYALWRLAGLARLEGNFPVERRYLERLT